MGFTTFNDLRRAQRTDARRTKDLATKRVVGAMGSGNLIIRETESCGGDRVVPNAAGVTFGPNAQALVATPGGIAGGTPGQRAVISRPPSGAGSVLAPRPVAKTVPVTKAAAPAGVYIALRATSWSGGNLVIDIASFDIDGAYLETLHTGVTLSGIEVGIGESGARRTLLRARSIAGVTGITDGSIFYIADAGDDAGCTLHVIDITTGAVSSRAFTGTEITIAFGDDSPLDRHPIAVDYFGDELYAMFRGVADGALSFEISQIVKWPADLSSETILGGDGVENMVHSGGIFFASEALLAEVDSLDVWHKQGYDDSFTADYVTGKPGPGQAWVDVEGWPGVDLGLADGKHWTIAAASGSWDLKVSTVTTAAVAASSGWTDVGLASAGAYSQQLNGATEGGAFDFNADRDTIIGFPIWTGTGSTLGIMSLPVSASSWGDATFVEAETTDFDADSIIADARS